MSKTRGKNPVLDLTPNGARTVAYSTVDATTR